MIVDIIRRNISAVRVGKVTRLDFLRKKKAVVTIYNST